MSVKIMIDSASDINEVEAKELGFLFIPIQVMLEDEEYLDGVNLLPETFFRQTADLQNYAPYQPDKLFQVGRRV